LHSKYKKNIYKRINYLNIEWLALDNGW
jgi:hypothetical protein